MIGEDVYEFIKANGEKLDAAVDYTRDYGYHSPFRKLKIISREGSPSEYVKKGKEVSCHW